MKAIGKRISPALAKFSVISMSALLFTAGCGRSPASLSHTADTTEAPTDGMIMARGVDMTKLDSKGFCVEPDPGFVLPPDLGGTIADGQKIHYEVKIVESSQELRKELEVSAEASYKSMFGSASAEAAFANKTKMNSYSLFALIRTKVVNQNHVFMNPKLRNQPEQLLKDGRYEEFFAQCGDGFVDGSTDGGHYYATLEIRTNSREDRDSKRAKLEAAFGAYKGGLAVSAVSEQISKDMEFQVRSEQEGGLNETANPKDQLADVLERARTFATIAKDHPRTISFNIHPYETLALPSGYNPAAGKLQRDVLKRLEDLREDGLLVMSDMDYILSHPSEFKIESQDALIELYSTVKTNLDAVVGKMLNCYSDAKNCSYDSIPASPFAAVRLKLPERTSPAAAAMATYESVKGEWFVSGFPNLKASIGFANGSFVVTSAAKRSATVQIQGSNLVAAPNWNDEGKILVGTIDLVNQRIVWSDGSIWKKRSLEGTWYMSGNHGLPCYVFVRNDNQLIFRNEKGEDTPIAEPAGDSFRALAWNGLQGTVTGETLIKWANGTFWTR